MERIRETIVGWIGDFMARISKPEYFMEIAEVVAKRATCIRRSVGAVIVKDNYIVSTGYNGPPSGFPHCTPESCYRSKKKIPSGKLPHLCFAVHAEVNCLIQAAIHGTSIKGGFDIYCTTFPCTDCLKKLINAGVKNIYHLDEYNQDDEFRQKLIELSGVKITKMN